jgi:cytoskeleton protein RodZ
VRIVVRATVDSYVAVRTRDNETLFSQLMRPGDSYEVPSGADLTLETGNAGGLQISVGGKRVPSLGPIGEIRRNIPLDAEKLLSGIN